MSQQQNRMGRSLWYGGLFRRHQSFHALAQMGRGQGAFGYHPVIVRLQGLAGGGFAAITKARGQLYGTAFSITDKAQLFMTFGHHAFDRYAVIFFDEPIGEACGLRIDPVTEGWGDGIWTTNCDGQPLQELTVLEEAHDYHQGPCADE